MLAPNIYFSRRSSTRLMCVRCLPTTFHMDSAGIRNAPAKRCAAFSLSSDGSTSSTRCPNSCARLNRLRSDQSCALITMTGSDAPLLRRTRAVRPSTFSASIDSTLIPRLSKAPRGLGSQIEPEPQCSRRIRAARSTSPTVCITGYGASRGSSHSTGRSRISSTVR